jgi:hypothetical protein
MKFTDLPKIGRANKGIFFSLFGRNVWASIKPTTRQPSRDERAQPTKTAGLTAAVNYFFCILSPPSIQQI